MELDEEFETDDGVPKYVAPQDLAYQLETFKNDLQYLSGTVVPSNVLTILQNKNITTC